ncbi:MAG TPA: hypothetical protein VG323_07885, partial [Thermoanaerobaculia bacterium]|nr:hypothetical protein [Thermoanaerobaculia bacterium]
ISQGITLSLNRTPGPPTIAPTTATVEGNVITVTDYVDSLGPPPPPQCMMTSVNVGALPPGDYTVNWYAQDIGPTILLGTFRFVVQPSRMRAVRH